MGDAFRYDHGELAKPVKTEQGFLRVDGYVSRPGIYEYVNSHDDEKRGLGKAGVVRRELRPRDEVFRSDSLAGFEDAPVTLGHPRKMVDPSNAQALRVGVVKTAARRDGDRAAATMLIDNPKAIAAIETGKRQLSPGYRIDEDLTSGTDPEFGRYDLVQRNIRINHLALVDRARGGSDLMVRMDGVAAFAVERSDDWQDGDGPSVTALTTSVEGHQHSLVISDDGGCTSLATAEGADSPHRHEWIRGIDGTITIAENAGHTHDVDKSTIGVRNDAELSTDQRNNLSADDFADPDNRKLPINDKKHVIAAMGGHGFSAEKGWASDAVKKRAFDKIIAAAKKFGIDSTNFEKEYGARSDAADVTNLGAQRADGGHMADDRMDASEQISLLKVRLDAAEKTASERKDALDTASKRADAAEAGLKTARERVDELEQILVAGSAKLETKAVKEHADRADAADRKLAELKDSIPTLVAERADAITKARAVLGPTYASKTKSNREIQTDVIKRLRPKEDVGNGVSDAHIAARFDSLIEDRVRTARSYERIDAAAHAVDNAPGDKREKHEETRDDRMRAWDNQAMLRDSNARGGN
ncbi:MAG TPA: DUF2213 domain-containing protein [Kofleriaceae bacterium]|jgi:hypothetical protein